LLAVHPPSAINFAVTDILFSYSSEQQQQQQRLGSSTRSIFMVH
jgi:hypothetical protein